MNNHKRLHLSFRVCLLISRCIIVLILQYSALDTDSFARYFQRDYVYIPMVSRHKRESPEESPFEQGISRNGISYGGGCGVFEIPGKWRRENGLRFLRGALSLPLSLGKQRK